MRLVIDFKGLNMVSQMKSGLGIPNIKDILERSGEQKSGFFCKLDFTAVFHQMLKGASVTPFELKVDKSAWHQAKSHGRPR